MRAAQAFVDRVCAQTCLTPEQRAHARAELLALNTPRQPQLVLKVKA